VELPKDFDTEYQSLKELFEEEYKRMYSLKVEDVPIEVYNFKALVTGPDYEIKLDMMPRMGYQDPLKGLREAYFGEDSGLIITRGYGYVEVPELGIRIPYLYVTFHDVLDNVAFAELITPINIFTQELTTSIESMNVFSCTTTMTEYFEASSTTSELNIGSLDTIKEIRGIIGIGL